MTEAISISTVAPFTNVPPRPPAAKTRRLLASGAGALIAIYWLDLGATAFFVAVALGFCAYAAMTVWAVIRVKTPEEAETKRIGSSDARPDSTQRSILPIYFAGR